MIENSHKDTQRYTKIHHHYLLALLFFISLFVLFFNIAKDGSRNFYLISDEATLELRVLNATRHIQYLGPYSRFGWNHPGPIYFYLLLPFYALFSMGTQSLYVGAVFINIVSLLTLLYFLFKSKNNYFFYFMAFLLSLYIVYVLGFNAFSTIWNPYVTILPFAAIIFMCTYLSLGNLKVLPLVALFSSFVVQTHVAYIPVLSGIIFISLLLCGLEKRRVSKNSPLEKDGQKPGKETLKSIGITIGVLLVLWIIPIVETIKYPPGNLMQLVYYFMSSTTSHGLSESIAAVSGAANAPLVKFLGLFFPGISLSTTGSLLILFFIQLVLVTAAGIVLYRSGKKYQLHLLVFGLAGLIIAVISAMKITGPIYPYLIKWMSVIGFINWSVIGFTFFLVLTKLFKPIKIIPGLEGISAKISPRHKQVIIVSLVLIISVVFFIRQQEAVHISSQIKRNPGKYRYIGEISAAITNYTAKNNISSFLVKPIHSLWPIEAGVVNQLYKSSVCFSLEDNWLFWFGYQFRQRKQEKDIIFFKKEKEPGKSSQNQFLIYHTGECSVYHIRRN
ncbi:MAG: hypothetical protein JSV88_28620 [Candidatus Aminicenantes bacterium]|nr:MAG: hypothetical protein JSV88_28620 [Candidatus Aminicenantes bacterium]